MEQVVGDPRNWTKIKILETLHRLGPTTLKGLANEFGIELKQEALGSERAQSGSYPRWGGLVVSLTAMKREGLVRTVEDIDGQKKDVITPKGVDKLADSDYTYG